MMEMVRNKIGGDEALRELRQEICPENEKTTAASSASAMDPAPSGLVGHDATIDGFLKSLREFTVKTEPNFKFLKVISVWFCPWANAPKFYFFTYSLVMSRQSDGKATAGVV